MGPDAEGRVAAGRAFARAALAGNPSDGFGGATLAVTVRDFCAEVRVAAAEVPDIRPPAALVEAALVRFARHTGVRERPYAVRWTTTVPREVGLAGSSAIVTATMRALGALHGVALHRDVLPEAVLAVETEDLGVAAGLQDRVAQAYEGLTFMDFDPALVAAHGRGRYEAMDPGLLPPLFLAYRPGASSPSTAWHDGLRARYARREPGLAAAMARLAAAAHDARDALLRGDDAAFGAAMDATFDERRGLGGLDPRHLAMVERARALGLSATYAGSGGAVVGACPDPERLATLARALEPEGCVVLRPAPG